MADTINNQNPVSTTKATETAKPEEKAEKVETKKDEKKDKKEKKPRRPFKVVMKTWSHGLGKEAGRISWEKKHDVLKDFVTIVLLCAFFAVLFFAIDMILVAARH